MRVGGPHGESDNPLNTPHRQLRSGLTGPSTVPHVMASIAPPGMLSVGELAADDLGANRECDPAMLDPECRRN